MENIGKLKRSLSILNHNISRFPIGAVTPEDFKPIEEKIHDLRLSLNCLNSRLQMLQTKINLDTSQQHTTEIDAESVDRLNVKLSNSLIKDNVSKFCIYSKALQDLFFSTQVDVETQNRMKAIMKKLFIINDKMLTWQNDIVELSNKEIELKDECSQRISDFHDFFKEQKDIREKKLEESNPEVAAKKERVKKLVYKINFMKRLITNFISAASPDIRVLPELEVMLKKHRDLISIDTILETTQNRNNERED